MPHHSSHLKDSSANHDREINHLEDCPTQPFLSKFHVDETLCVVPKKNLVDQHIYKSVEFAM